MVIEIDELKWVVWNMVCHWIWFDWRC